MSEMVTMLELAKRCEASTEARRRLDVLIACETDWPPLGPMISHWVNEEALEPDKREGYVRLANHPDSPATWEVPEYTLSLDAAMTLMPKGWRWWKAGDGRTGGSRMVVTDTDVDGRFTVLGECPCPDTVDGNAPALCAAALRARHALALSKGSDV